MNLETLEQREWERLTGIIARAAKADLDVGEDAFHDAVYEYLSSDNKELELQEGLLVSRGIQRAINYGRQDWRSVDQEVDEMSAEPVDYWESQQCPITQLLIAGHTEEEIAELLETTRWQVRLVKEEWREFYGGTQ